MIKNLVTTTCVICTFFLMVTRCLEQPDLSVMYNAEPSTRAEGGYPYYYYGYEKRKIFLQYKTDMVFLKFAPDADVEQISSLINSDVTLKPSPFFNLKGGIDYVILESVPGKSIEPDAIESFHRRPDVISATYMLTYREKSGKIFGMDNEFSVGLKGATSYAQLQKLAKEYHCIVGEQYPYDFMDHMYKMYVSNSSELDAMQIANLFYETELFEFAEPNFLSVNSQLSVNDPLYPQQWALKNTISNGGIKGVDINVESAWTITTGSSSVKIAILDDGVKWLHPDLAANLLSPGFDATGLNPTVEPQDGHGTQIAGIIAALQNNIQNGNYVGVTGISPNSKIMPVCVTRYGPSTLNYITGGSYLVDGINWAMQNGADIMNISLDTPERTDVTIAVIYAAQNGRGGKGCIFVGASGNNGWAFPTTISEVIAVGAIDRDGYRASFSAYGTGLDVVAPGVDISSTDPSSLEYTDNLDGTSFATPHVAGVAALILSINPDLTREEVSYIIERTAKKLVPGFYSGYTGYTFNINKPNGTWNDDVGYGLLNAYDACIVANASKYNNSAMISYVSGSLPNGNPGATDPWIYADYGGDAWVKLNVYPSNNSYTYLWSGVFNGLYGGNATLFFTPYGIGAYNTHLSVFITPVQTGNLVVKCSIYNGSSFVGTANYNLYVY